MNKYLKAVLLGLVIWVIPFVVSFFVWDMETNSASVSIAWFDALMAFSFAVGIAIAIMLYFPKVKRNAVKEGWVTGLIWYVTLIVMDLIVLVWIFGMNMADYYPLLLTYLNAIAISAGVGYMISKRR